jgi:hypothetical protein
LPAWADQEFVGQDFRDDDLSRLRTERVVFSEADLRAPRVDPTLWTTASLAGARIDVGQALAYAVAHGLNVHGD